MKALLSILSTFTLFPSYEPPEHLEQTETESLEQSWAAVGDCFREVLGDWERD